MTKEKIEELREFATKRTKLRYFPCKKTANALLETLGTVEELQRRVAELEHQKKQTDATLTKIRNEVMRIYRRGFVWIKPIVIDIDDIKNKIFYGGKS